MKTHKNICSSYWNCVSQPNHTANWNITPTLHVSIQNIFSQTQWLSKEACCQLEFLHVHSISLIGAKVNKPAYSLHCHPVAQFSNFSPFCTIYFPNMVVIVHWVSHSLTEMGYLITKVYKSIQQNFPWLQNSAFDFLAFFFFSLDSMPILIFYRNIDLTLHYIF